MLRRDVFEVILVFVGILFVLGLVTLGVRISRNNPPFTECVKNRTPDLYHPIFVEVPERVGFHYEYGVKVTHSIPRYTKTEWVCDTLTK